MFHDAMVVVDVVVTVIFIVIGFGRSGHGLNGGNIRHGTYL